MITKADLKCKSLFELSNTKKLNKDVSISSSA